MVKIIIFIERSLEGKTAACTREKKRKVLFNLHSIFVF
jgi:hypothetical protein